MQLIRDTLLKIVIIYINALYSSKLYKCKCVYTRIHVWIKENLSQAPDLSFFIKIDTSGPANRDARFVFILFDYYYYSVHSIFFAEICVFSKEYFTSAERPLSVYLKQLVLTWTSITSDLCILLHHCAHRSSFLVHPRLSHHRRCSHGFLIFL